MNKQIQIQIYNDAEKFDGVFKIDLSQHHEGKCILVSDITCEGRFDARFWADATKEYLLQIYNYTTDNSIYRNIKPNEYDGHQSVLINIE